MSEDLTDVQIQVEDEEIHNTLTTKSQTLKVEIYTEEDSCDLEIVIYYTDYGEVGVVDNAVTHFMIGEDETAEIPDKKPLELFNDLLFDVLDNELSNKDERKEAAEKIYKIVEDKVNEIQELG